MNYYKDVIYIYTYTLYFAKLALTRRLRSLLCVVPLPFTSYTLCASWLSTLVPGEYLAAVVDGSTTKATDIDLITTPSHYRSTQTQIIAMNM